MPKSLLFTAAFVGLLASAASAQTYVLAPTMNPAEPTKWGPPAEVSVTSPVFKKSGLAPVPLRVQVRFYKKVLYSCNYEYLVTNASATQTLSLRMYAYSDQKRTEILAPGQTVLLPLETNLGGRKRKDTSACAGYTPKFTIEDVQLR